MRDEDEKREMTMRSERKRMRNREKCKSVTVVIFANLFFRTYEICKFFLCSSFTCRNCFRRSNIYIRDHFWRDGIWDHGSTVVFWRPVIVINCSDQKIHVAEENVIFVTDVAYHWRHVDSEPCEVKKASGCAHGNGNEMLDEQIQLPNAAQGRSTQLATRLFSTGDDGPTLMEVI